MLRRSSRERKAVDFYTEVRNPSTRRHQTAVVSSSEDEEDDSHDSDDGGKQQKSAIMKSKKINTSNNKNEYETKRFPALKKKKISTSMSKCQSKNQIFHAIVSGKSLPSTVDSWVNSFGVDRVSAMSSLINSVLLSAGSSDDCIQHNMDLEGLDSSELEEVLTEMVLSLKQEQSKIISNNKRKHSSNNFGGDIVYFYPLGTSDRFSNSFRANFQSFWNVLITKVLTLQQQQQHQQTNKRLNLNTMSMRILLPLIEVLMALSNISSLPSIRDAVTEALLQTCVTIISVGVLPLRSQISASKRQESAATSSAPGASKGVKSSSKLAAILALQDIAEQTLEHYNNLVGTIFNTIFVHRYKDHFPVIRTVCAYYLGQLIAADPSQYLEATYLKYLGWLAYDKSSSVRRAVVNVMVLTLSDENNEKISKNTSASVSVAVRAKEFCGRFIDRWIEMAVGDVDEEVSFGMVKVMRYFQKLGLIDDLEQEKLDDVDKLVFDADSSPRIRSEALLFLMDHTEGFEEGGDDELGSDDEGSAGAGAGGRSKGKKSTGRRKSGDELRALKRKKRIAIQLETFAEFVEYHLKSSGGDGGYDNEVGGDRMSVVLEEAVENNKVFGQQGMVFDRLAEVNALTDRESNLIILLAEACLSLPHKSGILRDWETFISLLLRESDNLISSAMTDRHVSTLLRLFVCSAGQLCRWKKGYNDQQIKLVATASSGARQVEDFDDDDEEEEEVVGSKRKNRGTAKTNPLAMSQLADWQGLVQNIAHSLPKLLTRLGDDDAHVTLLLQLLEYCGDAFSQQSSSYERSVINNAPILGEQTLQTLFKSVLGLLETSHTPDRIAQLSSLLRLWVSPASPRDALEDPTRTFAHTARNRKVSSGSKSTVKEDHFITSSVRELLLVCIRNIVSASETIHGVIKSAENQSDSLNKKRRKGSNNDQRDNDQLMSNSLFALSAAIVKFSGLWQYLDCRVFLSQSIESIFEIFQSVSNVILQAVKCTHLPVGEDSELLPVLLVICQNIAKSLQSVCLWYTRDIFVFAHQLHKREEEEQASDDDEATWAHAAQGELLTLREVLVEILMSWLSVEYDKGKQLSLPFLRQLQCEAFRLIGDLRLQYPLRLRDDYCSLVSGLAFEPSAALVRKMEQLFGREEEELRKALEKVEEEDDDESDTIETEDNIEFKAHFAAPSKKEKRQQLANQLVWTILNPLSSIRYDIDHLNRRQAAAILGYLGFEASDQLQTMVNMWLKKLKEKDMAKYLESMLLALKKAFEDLLLTPLQNHQNAVRELDSHQSQSSSQRSRILVMDEEEELAAIVSMWHDKVEAGWKRVSQLSRRYAQTLGVGKCSSEVAGFVVQLLQVAMKYGLQTVHHLAFFQAGLDSFLGPLKAPQVTEVSSSLANLVHNLQADYHDIDTVSVYEAIVNVYSKEPEHRYVSTEIEKRCVDTFLSFGLKIGWKLLPKQKSGYDDEKNENNEEGREVTPPDSNNLNEFSPHYPPTLLSVSSVEKYGRRRLVGGRASPPHLEEERSDEMEVMTVTTVSTSSIAGSRPLASGLHLEGIEEDEDDEQNISSESVLGINSIDRNFSSADIKDATQGLSQSSEQSDDIFEEFDLRASRRRFG